MFKRKRRVEKTYGDPGGDEIALVEDKDQLLVAGLLLDVVLDTSAASSLGIAGIQNVDDNVRGIDNLVQLSPNTLRLTLLEDTVSGLLDPVCDNVRR
jgi:hypothetical protein